MFFVHAQDENKGSKLSVNSHIVRQLAEVECTKKMARNLLTGQVGCRKQGHG